MLAMVKDAQRVFVYTISDDNEHLIRHNFEDEDKLIGILERAQCALMAN
jgi:hypothetical protein